MHIRISHIYFFSVACVASIISITSHASEILRLPRSACTTATLFASSFEDGENFAGDPSLGVGGGIGNSSRVIAVPGAEGDPTYGNKTYYIHVPSNYQADKATPLVVVLHGAAGSQPLAHTQAQSMRSLWTAVSDANGFIVAAPVGSDGTNGSWLVPSYLGHFPTDYDVILAVIADIQSRYNIERQRRYLWGFSAGGHVALDILLNHYSATLDGDYFAGFGVNAGVSAGLACQGLSEFACNTLFSTLDPKTPVDMHHGTSDGTVNIAFAEADRTRFNSNGWVEGETFFWQAFNGGHTVLAAHPAEHWNNLCTFAVLP